MRAERTKHVSVARETCAPPEQDGSLFPEVKRPRVDTFAEKLGIH